MRPIRPAALPAAALSVVAATALAVGLAAEAEASPRPATLASAAATTAARTTVGVFQHDEASRPAIFGPSQSVSDAASPDAQSDAATADAVSSPAVAPVPAVDATLGAGAIGVGTAAAQVRALQVRLGWVGTAGAAATGRYDAATTAAVARFQTKHELAATGRADARTVATLARVSRRGAEIDARCTSVAVAVCVDKTQKVLRFVQHGRVVKTLDANFGPEKGEKGFGTYSRTREGSFHVYRRHAHHVSTGYGTPMRWSLFFDGAEAMHFSDYFRRGGYGIRSFGCVDIGSFSGARWVFQHSPLGTPFIVYH